ncbi:MAG: multicopper oxidase domain-containing protein [Methylibium sp.]|nr:multicopper oxidase domain-containing protein [Methylibium sp.]
MRGEGECGRSDHPAWSRFAPKDLYHIDVKEGSHSFHRELPTQTVWGYEGRVPGPLFHARYGRPILVRFNNKLPATTQGYGAPDISVHLHNLHTPSESDGYPTDWFSESGNGPTLTAPGRFKDHHYPMVYAGLDAYGGIGDPREALGTMWYHDHRVDFTAPNVYRGLAGFFLAFDDIDSGDEHDSNAQALRLPSGEYDVPLMISDKRFDSGGYLAFDQFNSDGFIGDKFLVNGKIQPFFNVARRKYRFRLLDGGPSRVYDLQLRWQNKAQSFTQIANDGNLLPAPLTRTSVQLGAAERADIVVDFSRYPIGAELFLVNRLKHLDGRKPEKDFLATPIPLLKFIVDGEPDEADESRVPGTLRALPPIDLNEVVRTRSFNFGRSNGAWAVNDRLFNNRPVASPQMGTAEVWVLRNLSGGWAHPIHIHFEEGRILQRNGAAPPPHERGRKDVYYLGPNETVRVFLRFRDFAGKYVMHCHNSVHEDHAMMVRYDIVS